jgi:hypothetical protein
MSGGGGTLRNIFGSVERFQKLTKTARTHAHALLHARAHALLHARARACACMLNTDGQVFAF